MKIVIGDWGRKTRRRSGASAVTERCVISGARRVMVRGGSAWSVADGRSCGLVLVACLVILERRFPLCVIPRIYYGVFVIDILLSC